MIITTTSTRLDKSELGLTNLNVLLGPTTKRNSASDAQAAPAEFSLAEEAAFALYLDSLPPDEALKLLVARIQARGAGQILPTPSPTGRAVALAHLSKERPQWTAEEAEKYERGWQAYEDELKAAEMADADADELRDTDMTDLYH